jgi:hypothetical protein
MGLHGASGHVQLFGNFRIVAAFEQQIGDLLLAWTQVNGLDFHDQSSWFENRLEAVELERAKVPRQDERLQQDDGQLAIEAYALAATCTPNSTLPAFAPVLG